MSAHTAPDVGAKGGDGASATAWYSMSAADVAAKLAVDIDSGLTAKEAADRLAKDGPNALPEEKPKPGWLRFLQQYTSYMQLILVGAGAVSILIKEYHTGAVLFLLTVVNAVVGLRQEGKAESAMNALKSMMKTTARVRRDGAEAEIPPRRSSPATSCSSPPATRCRPTAASWLRARCRSTNRR